MFNLDNAIQNWKRSLKRNPSFETGQIKEMETHLRDEIDELINSGYSEKEAFNRTVMKFGSVEEIGDEVYKTKTSKPDATPPWKNESWLISLLPNFIKVAIRNYNRSKLHSFINVAGLAIGLACTLLIFIHINHELSYDQFHRNFEDIYRITKHVRNGSNESDHASVQMLVGSLLRDEFPEIKNVVRFWRDYSPFASSRSPVIEYRDQQFRENRFYYVDSTFFEVFSFELLRGDPSTVFRNPYSVVLTETTAKKYFGSENPVGKTIKIVDSNTELEVTGVFKDIPSNSHIQFDFLSPFRLLEQYWQQNYGVPHIRGSLWTWDNTWVYIQLSNKSEAQTLQQKLPELVKKKFPEKFRESQSLHLQPLTDIYLHSNMEGEMQQNGNIQNIYIFSGIALFILLLAGINFVNLSTARSINRAKEVGVKKAIGASRTELFMQFLFEALLLTALSGIFALLFAQFCAPLFSRLIANSHVYSVLTSDALIIIAGLVLTVGLAAGSYPALVLSGFKPSRILGGEQLFSKTGKKSSIRKSLVVVQFTVSITLIVAVFVAYAQIRYLVNKDLGFDTEQVVVLNSGILSRMPKRNTTFVDKLLQYENIRQVTSTESIPGRFVYDYHLRPEGTTADDQQSFAMLKTDPYFTDVFDVEYIEGENLSKNGSLLRFVLNEAAVKELGWKDPIGKTIFRDQNGKVAWKGQVTGVIKNFHFRSLHSPIKPLILRFSQQYKNFRLNYGFTLVKISGTDIQSTLAFIEQTWNETLPGHSLDYFFLDDNLNQLYTDERNFQQVINYLAILAMVIACLGLFGLISFAARSRTKEIGIRKVLGATSTNIITLLTGSFMKLVGISFVIAVPLAYYLMKNWLQNFAHHIDLSIWVFIAAGLITVFISLITIWGQALRAARTNPVESLRNE